MKAASGAEGEGVEKNRQEETRKGTRDGYPKLGSGMRGIAFELGHPSKDEQGDIFDREFVSLGHPGVGELVKGHRGEEEQSGQDPADPIRKERELRGDLRKVTRREHPGEKAEDDQPGIMDANRNSHQGSDLPGTSG